jgi:DNA-binding Xre family transcriptional regulator
MIMINVKSLNALYARVGIKSQAELARKAGLTPQQLSNNIQGHKAATLTTIDKLCGVLDCQPGAFLEYKPD